MMSIMQVFVFVGAFALVGYVFGATVVPALPRMAALLRGELDPVFAPEHRLVLTARSQVVNARPVSLRAPVGWREAA